MNPEEIVKLHDTHKDLSFLRHIKTIQVLRTIPHFVKYFCYSKNINTLNFSLSSSKNTFIQLVIKDLKKIRKKLSTKLNYQHYALLSQHTLNKAILKRGKGADIHSGSILPVRKAAKTIAQVCK